MQITLDMYQTLAAAVVVLALGRFLRGRVRLLERFCIPAPVIGGVLFAIFTCVCYGTGIAEFAFDDILKEVCMVFFFTSVGFQANLKVLRSGGTEMIVFLVLVIGLIVGQNFVAIGLSKVLGISPLVGLCTGSIPMVGGHGTAGAFGPMLEGFGVRGATTLCTAAATYGLIAGSMMGGPVGKTLIEKHDLLKTVVPEDDSLLVEDEIKHERHASMYPPATFQIILAMGIGTIVSKLLSLTGMTFPVYIGAMIAAACIRNMGEINDIGGISLSLFLGMAMITLKLWQLADLAGPLVVLLAGQTVFILLYVVLVVFNVMGRDYDAAVLVSGTCGFGMGATPNAMANMQVVCEKYAPSIKAYLIVPLVGSLFADFLNSLAITLFINLI
ncbi:MAG: sodium/glutamate symporter [Faecalibacterium sp. CAG:82-related_59_9]|nr:MAG: sodium/glutamate symporter [Faecalibacterium sp. CAG:82-related_59_9]